MTETPESGAPSRRSRRWRIVGLLALLAIVAVVVGLGAVWLLFFAGEAPPAPSLDDALKLLQSPVPEG